MNDVGGTESGPGLRASKTSRTSDSTNFEYDDNDWDVGIGNLIIDLDANIAAEKNNEGGTGTSTTNSTLSPGAGPANSNTTSSSQMHIPSTTTTSSTSNTNNSKGKSSSSSSGRELSTNSDSVPPTPSSSSGPSAQPNMDTSTVSDKGLKMKIKRTKPGTKSVDAKHEIVKSDVLTTGTSGTSSAITPLSVSGKNSVNIDPKAQLPNTPNSTMHKDIKDIKSEDKTGPQITGTDKGKNQKRTPTTAQKKIKPGSTNPIIPSVSASSSSSVINKKESPGAGTDHKHLTNTSGHSTGATISSSGTKDSFSNSSSAFVKANNSNAPVKASSQVGIVNLHGGSITYGTGPSGVSASPSKNDKVHPTAPVANLTLDKVIGSGSFPKKSKPGSIDKNQTIQQEDLTSSSVVAFRAGINMELDTPVQTVGIKGNKNPQNNFQDACVGTSVGTITEPDCLGPCEPGSAVTLEGIVWHETESGVLVVNVTWRGKTYVGTLLDCTKNDWASPRFCDSPTSDLEMRTPKNRGKRGRAQTATPVSDPGTTDTKLRNGQKGRRGSSTNAAFVAPVSPMKPEQWPKRKTRGSENETQEEQNTKTSKRLKLTKESGGRNSNSPALEGSGPYSPQLIECPEPNCSKKYKHINGLRYHQSHAHSNNFAPEDSDSNMSTASTTNANTPADTGAVTNDDVTGESAVDMDITEVSPSGPETNSAPSTPVKKPKETNEKVVDGVDPDIKVATKANESEPLQPGTKVLPGKNKSSKDKEDIEKDSEIKEVTPATTVSRTHILTVPTYMSMANRTPLPSHSIPPQRTPETAEGNSNLGKPGTSGTTTNLASNIPKTSTSGVPWQPHANSSSGSQSQSSHVISSLNIPIPLTVPMSSLSSKEGDKSTKDLKPLLNSGSESPSKKQKHKKRSKERPDRDKERENISKSLEPGSKDLLKGNYTPPGSGGVGIGVGKGKDERRSSSEFKDLSRRDSEGVGGTIENPQSPAYSDISDANDSAPETELNPNENTSKPVPVSEIKKEGTGAPGIPTFFSPYYSPHSLENPFPGSNPAGTSGQGKPERSSAPGPSTDDMNSDKPKPKQPQHPEDRRSPNVDYRSKYLPPQQSFYPYPFSNYHFEQQPFGLMSENSFPPGRSMVEEKERETEESRRFGKGKSGLESERGESGPGSNTFNIKQEPVDRSGHKEHRLHGIPEEKNSGHNIDPKSDFGNDFSDMKRHSHSGTSHFSSSSGKHSKDFRREDRHSNKDIDSKDQMKRSSNSDHPPRHKSSESSSSVEKDIKNEGSKPTMETTGPPPPPTAGSYAYLPPGYLQGGPFGLPFDPNHHLYRQVMVPSPFPGSPYMHPSAMSRFPGPPGASSLPEDLSRPSPNASGSTSKALDLLQHHAAQYYASHKIHELQERALKSPSPQVNSSSGGGGISGPTPPSTTPASPQPRGGNISVNSGDRKPTDLSKDPKGTSASQSSSGAGSESSRSPPIHHVHTHMHSHTHIGYPIIPTVPPQYSPHYGVLSTPPATPATVIPPFSSQKPT